MSFSLQSPGIFQSIHMANIWCMTDSTTCNSFFRSVICTYHMHKVVLIHLYLVNCGNQFWIHLPSCSRILKKEKSGWVTLVYWWHLASNFQLISPFTFIYYLDQKTAQIQHCSTPQIMSLGMSHKPTITVFYKLQLELTKLTLFQINIVPTNYQINTVPVIPVI